MRPSSPAVWSSAAFGQPLLEARAKSEHQLEAAASSSANVLMVTDDAEHMSNDDASTTTTAAAAAAAVPDEYNEPAMTPTAERHAPPSRATEYNIGRLRRVPGVRGVLCIDEDTGQPIHIEHFGRGDVQEAWRTAGALADVTSRARGVARALLSGDDDDPLQLVTIRTRLQVEYVIAPDPLSTLAVAVVQDISKNAQLHDVYSSSGEAFKSSIKGMMDSPDKWLFGQADE